MIRCYENLMHMLKDHLQQIENEMHYFSKTHE